MTTKIKLALIKKVLDRDFPGPILSQGYDYFQEGKVLSVESEGDLLRAKVSGSGKRVYEVRIGQVFNDELLLSCDCPYEGYCKHEAAVLYYMRSVLSTPVGKSQEVISNKRKKLTLEGGSSSHHFRRLPLESAPLETILSELGTHDYYAISSNYSFEGILHPDGQLEIKMTVAPYSYVRPPSDKIMLKREGEDVMVKCLTCKKKTAKFCDHETTLLYLAEDQLEKYQYLSPNFNVDDLFAKAATLVKVAPEAMSKYFGIYFLPQGLLVRPKEKNVFSEEWFDTARNAKAYFTEVKAKKKQELEQHLANGTEGKVGFLWSMDGDADREGWRPLRFVHGPGLKTKEGIRSSDRKITNLPERFAPAQMSLARQLYFYFLDEDPFRYFQEIKDLMEAHIDTLNEVYHYVSTTGTTRSSDLYLVQFHPQPLDARFRFELVDGLIRVTREVLLDGEPFVYGKVIFSNGVFAATKYEAYLFPHADFERFMDLFEEKDQIFLPKIDLTRLTEIIQDFKQHFETIVAPELTLPEETLSDPTFQILLRELGDFIVFEPRLNYGAYSVNAFQEEVVLIDTQVHKVEESDRQFLVDFLRNAHPDFDQFHQVQDFVYLPIDRMLDNYWFLHFNEACDAAGIHLLGQKELSKFNYSKIKATTFSHVKSGIDWFEVDMGVSFGNEKIKMADWLRALRNRESFVRLKDGSLGILPEEWLAQARKIMAVAEVEQGELRISKYRFNIIDELFENLDDTEILQELAEKKKRLLELDTNKEYTLPSRLQASLRPYQLHGFAWLKFLEESGFGGILADDMGLGKTLQVLALLADQYNQPPSLIVVPRSLLFNWGAEIDKFCPTLTYTIHHGIGRARTMDDLLEYEVIITTYGTAAADVQLFKDFEFNYIVLDESQAIKNPASKRYKAMRLFRSQHKLTMTGTPIENNTFDLYAQLSFCSPGLLGSQNSFKQHFAVPIDNNRDVEAAQLLRKMIHPFVLRRTKEQVAQELPEKTETVIYCEMGNAQRRLYDHLKQKIREDIEAALEENGLEKSRFKMLDGLLRLRQMCNSPLLLNQSFEGQRAQSVKIDVLLEQLTEELDQHSALVFSQFVGFLSLIRRELDQRGIKYAYLDGSTKNRQAEVEKFMNREDIHIFLISLKAGNTGLNLTKADYVYILDPWWNPAVEAQAIDRTHRIGQDKNIFAYKLICKDTIEEKILKLQARKKEISADIIRTDDQAFKSLSKEELLDLFQ